MSPDVQCVVCGTRIIAADGRGRRAKYCGAECLKQMRRDKYRANPRPRKKKPTAFERLQARTVKTPEGCWEWQGYRMPFGHGQLQADNGKVTTTHRIAWIAANGEIPEGMLVRHKCDNPPCVNPHHLEIGTPADNIHDAVARGRMARGFRLPQTRLSDDDVRQIRSEYRLVAVKAAGGFRSNKHELAERYGVSAGHIKEIAGRRERAHVT